VPGKAWQPATNSQHRSLRRLVMQRERPYGHVIRCDDAGLRDNTLVIVTVNNGCAPAVGSFKKAGGDGALSERGICGYKSDICGRRPARSFSGSLARQHQGQHQSAQIVCLTDFIATCADILHATSRPRRGRIRSLMPVFLGTTSSSCVKLW